LGSVHHQLLHLHASDGRVGAGVSASRAATILDQLSIDINKCKVALRECEAYFDQRADADGDPTGTFIGNEEMALLTLVRQVLKEIE
jgi:hypothetical protein